MTKETNRKRRVYFGFTGEGRAEGAIPEAECSHLEPQTGSRERTQNGMKLFPSDILLARPLLLALLKTATKWRPGHEMSKTFVDISIKPPLLSIYLKGKLPGLFRGIQDRPLGLGGMEIKVCKYSTVYVYICCP